MSQLDLAKTSTRKKKSKPNKSKGILGKSKHTPRNRNALRENRNILKTIGINTKHVVLTSIFNPLFIKSLFAIVFGRAYEKWWGEKIENTIHHDTAESAQQIVN